MIISVVIPTYNGEKLLQEFLPSLFSALKSFRNNYEVVIVDNNSTDGTEELIKNHSVPKVIRFVKLEKNYGFAGAVNRGAQQAFGKYVLIINNDCFLQKDAVSKMINFLEKHSQHIATQPVVYKAGKVKSIEHIGYVVDLYKGKAETVKQVNKVQKFMKFVKSKRYVYGLSGTCLLVRRDIFITMGMFDDSFHSYLEDVNFFIRLAQHGYRYFPTLAARCTHQRHATSRKMGAYKEFRDLVNWLRIIKQNYSFFFIMRHFPSLLVERLRNVSGFLKKVLQ